MRLKVKGREKQQLVRKLPTQKSVSIVTALFKVDDELLAELREHQPAKRFKERELKVSPENAANLDNVRKKDQQAKDKNAKILDREVREMKKRFLDARVKAVKQSGGAVAVQVPKKRVAIEQEERDNRKKKKLAFLTAESFV